LDFLGRDHLRRIQEEAQTIVSDMLSRSARATAGSQATRNIGKEPVMSSPAYGNRLSDSATSDALTELYILWDDSPSGDDEARNISDFHPFNAANPIILSVLGIQPT
jgi:hypothetical protein